MGHIRQIGPGVTVLARTGRVRRPPAWSKGAAGLALTGGFVDNSRMASGRRDKRKLKDRPKYKQKRRLKDRRMKARKKAQHKRGLGRNRARRSRRGGSGKKSSRPIKKK